MKKTKVVGFIGGPGSGKSIYAASLYGPLKMNGHNAELATEYAKDNVYEERFRTLTNQIYIFGKQHHRIFRLLDKVEIIITDSPLVLCHIYDASKDVNLENLVISEFKKLNNILFFLDRDANTYSTDGRMQNLEEAKQIDTQILNTLHKHDIEYIRIPSLCNSSGVPTNIQFILNTIHRHD